MAKKVLLATEKPFAKAAVDGISKVFAEAGYELVKLEKYTDKTDLLKTVADVDAMIIRSDKADAAVIEAGKNLKIIVRAGAGYDNIDLAAATAKGICAMNTPGQNSNAVAELAMGMMVFLARNKFTEGNGSELKGKKLGIHAYGNVGKLVSELKGKKLGIHAYGNVGKLVAAIARGFGMEVYAFDPFVEKAKMEAEGVKVFDKDRGPILAVRLRLPAHSGQRQDQEVHQP